MYAVNGYSENVEISVLGDDEIDQVSGGIVPVIAFVGWSVARHAVVTYGPAVAAAAVRVVGATAAAYAAGEAGAGMLH